MKNFKYTNPKDPREMTGSIDGQQHTFIKTTDNDTNTFEYKERSIAGYYYLYRVVVEYNKPSSGKVSKYQVTSGTTQQKPLWENVAVSIANAPKAIQPKASSSSAGAGPFTSMFGKKCSTYECWIELVWNWATAIIVPLAVIVIVAAGIIYMTSGGNPDRIGLAKKMIFGALSGVALLLLARVFLVNFLFGTENKIWWNV